jgi:hypothetical protein
MSKPQRITRLVGVYDADGTLRGELAYWIGARLGRTHCSLCEITHGLVRPKAEWETCREGLPVRFDTYHRDDQPDAVRAATANVHPIVVAETDTGIVALLGPGELERCAGSVDRMTQAIGEAMATNGLDWPGM